MSVSQSTSDLYSPPYTHIPYTPTPPSSVFSETGITYGLFFTFVKLSKVEAVK